MRPIMSVPSIVVPGGNLVIEAMAPTSTTSWTAQLTRKTASYPLVISAAVYVTDHKRWFLTATVTGDVPAEMYSLKVTASGGILDTALHCVMVRPSIDDDFYFVQITDTHLPTHLYYYESGADTDTTEMADLHAVIDDINIMNPAFVVITGDLINEGELEIYLNKRYFTRVQRILREFDVPVYIAAGNHDIGGWDSTPPSDGTARRNWWKFFGWRYLSTPPSGDPLPTQNYSFNYGGAHFVALEAYNNYDRWRLSTYGYDSFMSNQISWLTADLAAAPPSAARIAFYHMDFQDQLNLSSLGIDCALWGHVHSSSGSVGSPPFNLSLKANCDGGRTMRLVRVVGGATVDPSEPIDTGVAGQKLNIAFSPVNDGTATEVTATVVNNMPESFEHGLVKFLVPAASMPYGVSAGEVIETIVEGSVATYYVEVNLPTFTTTSITINPTTGIPAGAEPALALLGPVSPNPTQSGTTIGFSLGSPARVRVEIFNLAGRRVATLRDGVLPSGSHEVTWSPGSNGQPAVTSGVYFYRVESGGEALSGKLVVLR
jgi:hypothetical protein